ncbi:MAG: NYN domain-containing protein [Sphingomonas sp.]|nr:NYN domain-containing protein [Sphingomonas sp.]
MNDESAPRNIALLIDADNASYHALDPVLTVLAELGTVNIRRVYGNWSKPALKNWQAMTIKHGIEPQQQFDVTKGKNATDMKVTIDAMDLLFRGRVEGFGIMSSDADFMPLAMRIRQDGLPVYGFGNQNTPEGFRQACTRFIDVDILMKTDQQAVEHPTANPVDNGQKTDQSAATPVNTSPKIDNDVIKLLIDAYDASKHDAQGYVSLSHMGQIAGNRSSFDARNYGFRRLSDLLESISNFTIERRDSGHIYVRRVR